MLQHSEMMLALEQVVEPAVKAYLYTWGKGRTTAEGEHIPTRIEQMEIHHIDGMLVSSDTNICNL